MPPEDVTSLRSRLLLYPARRRQLLCEAATRLTDNGTKLGDVFRELLNAGAEPAELVDVSLEALSMPFGLIASALYQCKDRASYVAWALASCSHPQGWSDILSHIRREVGSLKLSAIATMTAMQKSGVYTKELLRSALSAHAADTQVEKILSDIV